jgi:conjugal transfer pilin signal peptidase TrbI
MNLLKEFSAKNSLLYASIDPEPNFRKMKEENREFRFKRFRHWLWPLLLVLLAFWIGNNFRLVINQTDSLPQKVWILVLNKMPKKGDYVAFKPPLGTRIPENIILHKQVLGVEGDRVTLKNRDFYINGRKVATAKTHSLKGEPLALGPTGTLQKGQYYVSTPHKDSFDSRYEKMGWIDAALIIGVLYPLW